MLVVRQEQKQKREQKLKVDETLSSKIRKHITNTPGVHFNDLLRTFNIAPGTLQYHLNRMERREDIIVLRGKYKTLYFPETLTDPVDQKIILILRQRLPRNLLLILLEESHKTGSELTKLLNITKSTLSYYTHHLEKLGVLKSKVEGRTKRYSVKDPERIAKVLKEHRRSFGDEMVDRFVELWVRI
ncbi:winged helix-turn-helix transcriptional regulator [[Eubacterium] cellulosolvens]